ncbi:MAG: ASCH domain-containing protein [Bacteroidales bacterium]|nr:ASCH domain-containing protein [Bacteroidales bacterium]
MSIKPVFAEKILSGEKTVEIRKVSPTRLRDGDKVIIYASSPVKKIVGEMIVARPEFYGSEEIYDWYKEKRICLSKEDFDKYLNGRKCCCAIPIYEAHRYEREYELGERYPYIKQPPQSFYYLMDEKSENALDRVNELLGKFYVTRQTSKPDNIFRHNRITSFCEDENGALLLGIGNGNFEKLPQHIVRQLIEKGTFAEGDLTYEISNY